MTRIVHLSDLHFGSELPDIVDELVGVINHDRPDLVVVSGDLTMGARSEEFRSARRFIDRLEAPVLSVPGNHDISPYRLWQRFTNPYLRWRRYIAPVTEPVWRNDEVGVIGLDTVKRMQMHLDWSRGGVSPRRLQRLVQRLDQLPGSLLRIVVAHHPLLPMTEGPVHAVASGAGPVLAALSAHGVVLVLAGHLHRRAVLAATGPTGLPMILQGATATSSRLRGEPNGYNRITLAGGQLPVIERCVWQEQRWHVMDDVQSPIGHTI